MIEKLEIIEVGDSIGFILPPEVLANLGVKEGDSICFEENENGLELFGSSPNVRYQMKIAKRVMDENSNLLRKLAEDDTRPHPDLPQA